jgi:hypothetical protein
MHKSIFAKASGLLLLALIYVKPVMAQIDFSGEWFTIPYEDPMDRRNGPEIGDYTGLPVNDANRFRADTHDPSSFALPEWECRPHGVDWITFGLSDMRVDKVVDPVTGRLVAWHFHWLRSAYDRYVWMDGRPHPSEYAPYTWEGFSTGHWEGDTLVIDISHASEDYYRRNGIMRSAHAKMRQYLFMDGDYITWTTIAYDPAYLTEPLIRNASYRRTPHAQLPAYPCPVVVEEVRPKGQVPHFQPGQNPYLSEFAMKREIPLEAIRGGAETMYPEYRKKLAELFKAIGK